MCWSMPQTLISNSKQLTQTTSQYKGLFLRFSKHQLYHHMKLTKEKVQEFFGIESGIEKDSDESYYTISISLWHFVWIIAIIAFLVYRHYH